MKYDPKMMEALEYARDKWIDVTYEDRLNRGSFDCALCIIHPELSCAEKECPLYCAGMSCCHMTSPYREVIHYGKNEQMLDAILHTIEWYKITAERGTKS